VAPSILSADFSKLGAQVAEVMEAGARVIHVDVMDGHFVPPITMGPLVASAIADQVHDAGGGIDVHLMVARPADHVEEFARAGADCITAHFEADPNIHRTLGAIREAGCLAGVAINPGTPAVAVSELGPYADVVLCMSVNPGWGGQSFIETSPEKVRRIRDIASTPVIEMDGEDRLRKHLVRGANERFEHPFVGIFARAFGELNDKGRLALHVAAKQTEDLFHGVQHTGLIIKSADNLPTPGVGADHQTY